MKDKKNEFADETERIMANSYLAEKLLQSRKDMEEGKGVKIDIEDFWDESNGLFD